MNEMDQAQTIDRALQQCSIIYEALRGVKNQKDYRQTSQELINIFRLLHSNPYLWTIEVMNSIKDITDTATGICSILRQRGKSCFVALIASALKKKSYRDLFGRLEHQNNILAAYVHQERLGTLPTTSSEMGVDPSLPDAIAPAIALGLSTRGITYTENGTQVIGQRVSRGDEVQRLTGEFSYNIHRGSGDQVIGFLIE
ncbi:hypothetical protein F4678DRAFT_477168 [Xylaria arbuscula]|nr:hypothetical protein F4678DRAFT_477168 [Xylaria arbuscula]